MITAVHSCANSSLIFDLTPYPPNYLPLTLENFGFKSNIEDQRLSWCIITQKISKFYQGTKNKKHFFCFWLTSLTKNNRSSSRAEWRSMRFVHIESHTWSYNTEELHVQCESKNTPSGVGGFESLGGSGRVRHQRLPRPPPPPRYGKNSYRILRFAWIPLGSSGGERGVRTPVPPLGQLRRWSPEFFWHFPQTVVNFSPNFTPLLYIPIYAELQIFIQLTATLTKFTAILSATITPS